MPDSEASLYSYDDSVPMCLWQKDHRSDSSAIGKYNIGKDFDEGKVFDEEALATRSSSGEMNHNYEENNGIVPFTEDKSSYDFGREL